MVERKRDLINKILEIEIQQSDHLFIAINMEYANIIAYRSSIWQNFPEKPNYKFVVNPAPTNRQHYLNIWYLTVLKRKCTLSDASENNR